MQDALRRLGVVTGRRMFGGVGVYCDGVFFAILDDGVAYFRVSELTKPKFEAERSRPFTYATKNGEATIGSFWRLPERLLDDSEELEGWGRTAIAAAREAQASKLTKKRPAAKPKRRASRDPGP